MSMSDLHAEGVRDLDSYNLGILHERDRFSKLLERQQCFDYASGQCDHAFCYAIARVIELLEEGPK